MDSSETLLKDVKAALAVLLPQLVDAVKELSPLVVSAKKSLEDFDAEANALDMRAKQLVSRLECDGALPAVQESLAQLETHLSLLRRASESIRRLLSTRDLLSRLAHLLTSGDEDVAADALEETRQHVANLKEFLKEVVDDPAELSVICFPLEAEISIQTEELKRLLCSQLGDLIKFQPRRLVIRSDGDAPHLRIERLWHGIEKARMTEEVLNQCGSSLVRSVLHPLVVTAETYEDNAGVTIVSDVAMNVALRGQEDENGNRYDVWEFRPVRLDNNENLPALVGTQKSVLLICEQFESLVEFLTERMFQGHPNMLLTFGEKIYKEISSLLKQLLLVDQDKQSQCSGILLEKLFSLETGLQASQFIGSNVNTLSSFVHQYKQKLFERKQALLLAEAAELSAFPCSSSRRIGPDSGDFKFDEMMRAINKLEAATEKLSDPSKQRQARALMGSLKQSSLCLPNCTVSTAVYTTLEKAEELIHSFDVSDSDELFWAAGETVQNVISVYLTLRVSRFKKALVQDPVFSAVFFNDCSLLITRLLTLSEKKRINGGPSLLPPLACLNLLLVVRNVQERALCVLMAHQRENVLTLLSTAGDFAQLSTDAAYTAAEAKIGSAVQFIKGLAAAWSEALPKPVATHCLGRVVDLTLETIHSKIVSDVERYNEHDPESMRALSQLVTSVVAQFDGIVNVHCVRSFDDDGPPNTVLMLILNSSDEGRSSHESKFTCERWESFKVFAELVQADETAILGGTMRGMLQEQLSPKDVRVGLTINQWIGSRRVNDMLEKVVIPSSL